MTPDERHQLARALAAMNLPHPLLDPRVRRRRRFGMLFMIACCVGLAAWIAILVLTLPGHFTSRGWQAAWIGLDIAELAGFAATAWALDYGSGDFVISVATAVLVELPIAFLLFSAARRLVRVTVESLMQVTGVHGPVPPLWRIPLFADGLEECLPARLRSPEARPNVTAAQGPSSLVIR